MATSSANVPDFDGTKYWVSPSRNYRSSARLRLQHYLVQNTLGYLLEPAVEKAVAGVGQLKVADLACGNGVWLTELASHLAKTHGGARVQLDGFDIHPTNFPDPAYLPAGVTLTKLDILAEDALPSELKGVYDVVHIRAFDSVIRNAEAIQPVLTVASALLKPGGFLQWEEMRGDNVIVEAPRPDVSKIACATLAGLLQGVLRAPGSDKSWVDVLDTHVAAFGFRETELRVQEKREQDYQAWTENYLMAWEEAAACFPSEAEEPEAQMTREGWAGLLAKGVAETEQGVVIHLDKIMTAVGQKPQ